MEPRLDRASDLEDLAFSAHADSAEEFLRFSAPFLRRHNSSRALDLGCGEGAFLARLEQQSTINSAVGIDFSDRNIRATRRRGLRSQTIAGDYTRTRLEPFDLIFAESVIHLIEGADDDLVSKISGDLRPGGLLICTMPPLTLRNRIIVLVRRFMRLVRSRVLERVLARIAGLIFSGWSEQEIRDRLHYLYLIPPRFMSQALQQTFSLHGLNLIEERDWPMKAFMKPDHRFYVFEKSSRK